MSPNTFDILTWCLGSASTPLSDSQVEPFFTINMGDVEKEVLEKSVTTFPKKTEIIDWEFFFLSLH